MPRDALFEYHRIGAFIKVTAIDTETGTEVSIVGPSNGAETMLRANALRKLEAALRRRAAESP